MNTEIELVTPEYAKIVLSDRNTQNRPLRPSWVNSLSSAIKRGEWQLTHQGIAFDTEGILIDGQHRLAAIAKSGMPVKMFVTRGVDSGAFKAIDMHAKRTIGDLTKLNKKTAEVCKIAAQIAFNGASPSQVLKMAETGLADMSDELNAFCSTNRKVASSAPIRLAVSCMAISGGLKDYAFSSYKRLVVQNYLEMSAIESAFTKRISEDKEVAVGQVKPRLIAIALKVCNPNYKDCNRLVITPGEEKSAIDYIKSSLLTGEKLT
jgi:hypothetical protein